jgi:hypothetical protein
MGSFKAFVEIGRVCVISHGKEFGQLVVIADVVDQNQVRKHASFEEEGEKEREPPSAPSLSLSPAARPLLDSLSLQEGPARRRRN